MANVREREQGNPVAIEERSSCRRHPMLVLHHLLTARSPPSSPRVCANLLRAVTADAVCAALPLTCPVQISIPLPFSSASLSAEGHHSSVSFISPLPAPPTPDPASTSGFLNPVFRQPERDAAARRSKAWKMEHLSSFRREALRFSPPDARLSA